MTLLQHLPSHARSEAESGSNYKAKPEMERVLRMRFNETICIATSAGSIYHVYNSPDAYLLKAHQMFLFRDCYNENESVKGVSQWEGSTCRLTV